MAIVKTNFVSSSSPVCNIYPNPQKSSVCFGRRSCRLKTFHRKVNFQPLKIQSSTSFTSDFYSKRILLKENQGNLLESSFPRIQIKAQNGLKLKNALKWWEKGLQPNMREVSSANDLVESLINAGDKLVVVDFFSPGCGGCKALHPKICQLAEMNPEVQFLQVNYEEHKSMCYSLNVHVLPFFRFYRGAQGRVCSFSCTNATIKKFRDALAKHSPDRCSLGPTKGLEEKELAALAANKDLNFTLPPRPEDQSIPAPSEEEIVPAQTPLPLPLPLPLPMKSEEKTLITSGR